MKYLFWRKRHKNMKNGHPRLRAAVWFSTADGLNFPIAYSED
jgi:hypothetical protein